MKKPTIIKLWKKIYTLMLRIQMKLESFSNQQKILKIMSMKVKKVYDRKPSLLPNNYGINKSKEILKSFRLLDWRIPAYLGLLIYWSVILLGTFAL